MGPCMAGETPALVRLSGVSVCLQPSDYIRRGRICEWLVFSFFFANASPLPHGEEPNFFSFLGRSRLATWPGWSGGDVSLVANDRREKMKLQTYGLVHDLICKPSETDKKQNKTRITSLTGNPDPKPCQGSMVETPDRRNGSSN